MTTNNFKMLTIPRKYGSVNSYIRTIVLKKIDGTELTLATDSSLSASRFGIETAEVMFGSDNTSESVDDYRLGNIIDSFTVMAKGNDFTETNITYRYDESPIHMVTATKTIRNDTSDPITIREIALYSKPNNSDAHVAMMARQVITPITVNPGESYTFNMTLDML